MRTRVLFVHHGDALGGAFLSLFYLLRALDAGCFECVVCSAEHDKGVLEKFSDGGFETCACRLMRFAHTTLGQFDLAKTAGWCGITRWFADYEHATVRLARMIHEVNPDIVHFNSLTLAPYARVPHEMGIPTVVHVREPVLDGYLGLRKNWLRGQLNGYADKVIGICKDNLERLHLDAGKGVLIYNPVNFDKFDHGLDQGAAREELGISEDAKTVLFAGGSDPIVKGLHEFLRAMSHIRESEQRLACLMPSFTAPPLAGERVWSLRRRVAWLLGMFRDSDRWSALIAKNDLRSCIFGGAFSYSIEKWIAASDVVCVPHIQPHFSRTVMEAGAMAKPVVGFRIAGIEEVVRDGETGLLVEVGDVDGLAGASRRLLDDADLRERLGRNGLLQARQLFDARKCAANIEEVYDGLLAARL